MTSQNDAHQFLECLISKHDEVTALMAHQDDQAGPHLRALAVRHWHTALSTTGVNLSSHNDACARNIALLQDEFKFVQATKIEHQHCRHTTWARTHALPCMLRPLPDEFNGGMLAGQGDEVFAAKRVLSNLLSSVAPVTLRRAPR